MNKRLLVKLENVSKTYPAAGSMEFSALKDVSLEVYDGDFLAIMGPSGHGKTTLLNVIGLLDKPSGGRVIVDGVDTANLDDSGLSKLRNEKLGFVFQQYNLVNRMSVLENIEIPLVLRDLTREERVKIVTKSLEMVAGQRAWLRKKPSQLSGGEQQRVAIARAIVGDPQIILADEPTGNLDTASSKIIMQTCIRLNKSGRTLIMVTHNAEVAMCSKRILKIRDGKIVGEEFPDSNKCIFREE